MTDRRIKVLVVDDSAFARKVMREVLTAGGLDVVGIATDGFDALEKVSILAPDVVTLDLVMPNLDGLGLLNALPEEGGPRVVIVSKSDGQSELVLNALAAGAVDVVQKPTALATDRLYELSGELVAKVKAAAAAAPRRRTETPARLPTGTKAKARQLVVVGTSTGGPQALTRFLSSLPEDFSSPMAIVLHIPIGYTEAVAQRLDGVCALEVKEAQDGMELRSGLILLAQAGVHLLIDDRAGRLVTRFSAEPSAAPHRPSVDELFKSAAEARGSDVVGVVLTGMGHDGLEGAKSIRAAGGRVLTEAASSCVVYGMPRAVAEAGLSNGEATVDRMTALLLSLA